MLVWFCEKDVANETHALIPPKYEWLYTIQVHGDQTILMPVKGLSRGWQFFEGSQLGTVECCDNWGNESQRFPLGSIEFDW